MKNIIILLLTLLILGILLLRSNFYKYSEENYITPQITDRANYNEKELDLEFLKREFKPAYEF